ncbi:hypothetical protein DFJ73DRAFT_801801 [Zopfochytrium polystomum]|nr:hypothetical protein DFJ73DRAFT_801801 [Zopfochytrium polystomum]
MTDNNSNGNGNGNSNSNSSTNSNSSANSNSNGGDGDRVVSETNPQDARPSPSPSPSPSPPSPSPTSPPNNNTATTKTTTTTTRTRRWSDLVHQTAAALPSLWPRRRGRDAAKQQQQQQQQQQQHQPPPPSPPPPPPPRKTAPRRPTAAAPRPAPPGWDPAAHAILLGALLSRTSPLRALRRDRDALALVLSFVRLSRASPSCLDWTQHGYWPEVARIDFPARLVRSRPLPSWKSAQQQRHRHRRRGYRGGGEAAGAGERTADLVDGGDFSDWWDVQLLDLALRMRTAATWDDLEAWAVARGLFVPPPPPPPPAEEDGEGVAPAERYYSPARDATGDPLPADTRARRSALVTALRSEIEPFHVNMLPIVMGSHASLPDKCKRYSGVVNRCLAHCPGEANKVGYLTIHEGFVEPGRAQRRPGLHVESPGYYGVSDDDREVRFDGKLVQKVHDWGFGFGPAIWSVEGGVFQASSVANTCRVWDCVVQDPTVIGALGSVEHLRGVLDRGPPGGEPADGVDADEDDDLNPENVAAAVAAGKVPVTIVMMPGGRETRTVSTRVAPHAATRGTAATLAANTVAWMTDRTPHESLPPIPSSSSSSSSSSSTATDGSPPPVVFRQYFRLVTSRVTAWYEAHSTRNDECRVRPPRGVRVVVRDKFAAAGLDGGGGVAREEAAADAVPLRAFKMSGPVLVTVRQHLRAEQFLWVFLLYVFTMTYTRAFRATTPIILSHLAWLGLFMFFGFLAIAKVFTLDPKTTLILSIVGNAGCYPATILSFYLEALQLQAGTGTATPGWRWTIGAFGVLGVVNNFMQGTACTLRPIFEYMELNDDMNRSDLLCSAFGTAEFVLKAAMCVVGVVAMRMSVAPSSSVVKAVQWRIASIAFLQVIVSAASFVVFFEPFSLADAAYLTWGNPCWIVSVFMTTLVICTDLREDASRIESLNLSIGGNSVNGKHTGMNGKGFASSAAEDINNDIGVMLATGSSSPEAARRPQPHPPLERRHRPPKPRYRAAGTTSSPSPSQSTVCASPLAVAGPAIAVALLAFLLRAKSRKNPDAAFQHATLRAYPAQPTKPATVYASDTTTDYSSSGANPAVGAATANPLSPSACYQPDAPMPSPHSRHYRYEHNYEQQVRNDTKRDDPLCAADPDARRAALAAHAALTAADRAASVWMPSPPTNWA